MNFNMNLQDKYFYMIENEIKTLEVRLLDKKRKKIKIGDTITFYCSDDKHINVKVTSLKIYDSFEDLLKDNNISEIGLNTNSIEEAIFQLNSIYPKEKSSIYKTLAIGFSKI